MLDFVVAAVGDSDIVASLGPVNSSQVLPSAAAVVFVAAAVFEPAPFASGKVWGPGFARPVPYLSVSGLV